MSEPTDQVITRFAPSPTGHLHIGGARTALFCWAWARRSGGTFLLRMEDTDRARSSEASGRAILADLAWLGLAWDEGPTLTRSDDPTGLGGDPRGVGPFFQSQRLETYNQHIDRLIEKGLAYPAFETPEELDAQRKAALAEKRTYRYDRAALELSAEERAARVAAGEAHVVRFNAANAGEIMIQDAVLGEVRIADGELEDFVIRKQDGFPTYHFSVVVDDELMGVTHVLRGQEHLSNTPKHVALQRALGFRVPVYAHMPLIFNEKGAKMSKRERDQSAREAVRSAGLASSPVSSISDDELKGWTDDKKRQLDHEQLEDLAGALDLTLPEVSVDDFRRAGYLPEVICNFIALLGWTPSKNDDGSDREVFDLEFLASDFDIARIGRSNARFDRNKLMAFNADVLQNRMNDAEFGARWHAWCEEHDPELGAALGDRFDLAARAIRPRVRTLAEGRAPLAFALISDDAIEYDEKAVKKFLLKGEPNGLAMLERLRGVIESADFADAEALEASLKAWAEENELGMGKVAQPLRVALTGAGVSPGLGDTLALVGKQSSLARIDRCLSARSAEASG